VAHADTGGTNPARGALNLGMRRTGVSGHWGRSALAGLAAVAAGGVLAVSGVAGTGAPGGKPADAEFRLADGSAACNYADGAIVCRADGVDAATVLEADGSTHDADASAVAWDDSTPVLLPGESWWNGDVSCVAGEREVTCTAADGELSLGSDAAGGASSADADLG
jgi:hypothetical protein